MSIAARQDGRRMNAFDHAIAPVLPVLLAVGAFACLAGIWRAAAIIPLHVPLDPNEGWNAYHAAAAMAGHGLYPDPRSFMLNNYPPLSFYIVGMLGILTGDQIVAGRIISLISFICICAFVLLAARRLGASLQGALLSAIVLAATFFLTSDYVGMEDPQLLGNALQLGGFLFLLREKRPAPAVFAAAFLFVAGGFVKHNLFVLPLAAAAWLASFDRRSALRLAVSGICLCLAGLVAFRLLSGFDLLARLASARLWFLEQFASSLAAWFPFAVVPLVGMAAYRFSRPNDLPAAFLSFYAALGIAIGAFMGGGAGVDANAMFDADIALALGAGLVMSRLLEERRPAPHLLGRAFAFAALVPFMVPAAQSDEWRDSGFWLHPLREETSLAAQDIRFLRSRPGPAICESLAFCYWAGKPDPVDVFNLDQQFRTGRRDMEPFLDLLGAHHFTAIELDETEPFPLPNIVRSAVLYNYRIDHTNDEGTFLVPR
jgi:hypothetical protein